jgi:glycosyltransferase involved in cell wall biosynthesis
MRPQNERTVLFVDNQVNDFLKDRIIFARTIQKAGFEVHVAVPLESGWEDISRQGICVHTIQLRRKSTRLIDELRCYLSLLILYERLRPILVHHLSLKPTLYGGIAARATGIPAVVSTLTGLGHLFSTHTVKTRILRSIVAKGLRLSFGHQCHTVIVQNPEDLNRLVTSCKLRYDRAVLIKGSGVDLSLFKPMPQAEGLPVVLMGARLLWAKGVSEFVAASRALRVLGIQARFILAGEPDTGHPSAIPVSTLRQWHDAGDVEWVGWRHDLPALIAQSHIVCLPSSYGEGLPRILLEAAASGRAIVATDCPGSREIVRHGENGLLVPIGDTNALTKALKQLIENASLRLAMGIRGREIAAASASSLDDVIEANLTVYRSVLSSFQQPDSYS